MYSKKSWGGKVDPFILVKFLKHPEKNKEIENPRVSVVIWEWVCQGCAKHIHAYTDSPQKDTLLLGAPSDLPVNDPNRDYICDDKSIKDNYCNATHKGEWVLAPEANNISSMYIRTDAIYLNDPKPINYPVSNGDKKIAIKTGYYCVAAQAYTDNPDVEFEAIVTFRNAYGELQAAQIAKLPFYGGITILYFVVLAFWGFLYFQNKSDILAVQNYITAILVFLVVEM
jgi:hypothetical protein